jgi:tetratricopeptide (TPR) repeat protein
MCTPKVTEQARSTEPTNTTPSKPARSTDPCARFSDSYAGEAALDAHVIYRDYLKMKNFKEAYTFWKQAFLGAPAADGKRKTHFEDGIVIYDNLLNVQESDADKKVYLDSILYIYDRLDNCYGEGGYVDGRIGFDYYYKYRSLVTNSMIFDRFTKSLDIDGLDAHAFVINPFTALLVEMHQNKEIDQEKALKYAKLILEITNKNKDNKDDGWPIVLNYAPARLETFEIVKGFYNCDYYVNKYYSDFEDDNANCDVIETVIARLKWGDCDENSPQLQALRSAYMQNCFVTTVAGSLRQAKEALEEGRYNDAIQKYSEYIESTDDIERKAKYTLRIAKIYYAHLKNFRKAREYARAALKLSPNWGEPLIIIGKLYASSGPLCGPGRGWDSQIVTWPAIDKFNQAKRLDPSVSAEANKWINYYSKYMPSVEDIFQRQLKEGSTFRVGCWIQENTIIRAAPRS